MKKMKLVQGKPSSIRLQNTLISSVPGAPGTETGLFLTGAFPGGAPGSIDGTSPWTSKGGGAILDGVDTAGILGGKDGGVAIINGGDIRGVPGGKDGSCP